MPLHRLTSTALAGLLSLVMLLLAAPSLAQEAGADSDPAYGTLADLIEDDASRPTRLLTLDDGYRLGGVVRRAAQAAHGKGA